MVRFEGIVKEYRKRGAAVRALDGVDLTITAGSFVVVKGPSGCGKSTLLLAAGGMLRPSAGAVFVGDVNPYALGARARAGMRRRQVGFVFQMFHLVPYLSVLENVRLGAARDTAAGAAALLNTLGLGPRIHHRPAELSAGEKQRAALARALVNRPPLLLADEPTGNLDPQNARQVMEHLDAYRRAGGTVLLVTHGDDADPFATQQVRMANGRIVPA